MSEPAELKLPGERMGLARMGRMTAFAVPHMVTAFLGECVLVDETAEHIRVPAFLERVTYTTLGKLDGFDAEKCGYQHAALELTGALRKINPHLHDDSPVTILEWSLAREAR